MKKMFFLVGLLILCFFISPDCSFDRNQPNKEECFPIWNFGEIVAFRFDITMNSSYYSPKVYECITHYKDVSSISSLSVGFLISSNQSFLLKKVVLKNTNKVFKVYHYDKNIHSSGSLFVYPLTSSMFYEDSSFQFEFFLNTL